MVGFQKESHLRVHVASAAAGDLRSGAALKSKVKINDVVVIDELFPLAGVQKEK